MKLNVSHYKIFFVTKYGRKADASMDLLRSYTKIADSEFSAKHLEWISEDNCISLPNASLSEDNMFVLEMFEGQIFKHLHSSKATILGPQCVLMCQLTDDVVPNIKSPILTLAMENVVASITENQLKKRKIQRMIRYMGGSTTNDITESTTHLITETINSPKYEKASMRNVKIMKTEWISEVWKLSKTGDTSYFSEEFYHKYKMPVFSNLTFLLIDMSEIDKNEIIELIQKNGGIYIKTNEIIQLATNGELLISKYSDILILPNEVHQMNYEELEFKDVAKYSRKYLKVDWVRNSVSKGYLLPYNEYKINTDFHPEGSLISNNITLETSAMETTTEETDLNPEETLLQPSNTRIEDTTTINNITLETSAMETTTEETGSIRWRNIKKRRFSLYLTPFNNDTEQLQQSLKDQINELNGEICEDSLVLDPSTTHVICSKLDQSEIILSAIASGRWLLCPDYINDSFQYGHFLNEEHYEWRNPEEKERRIPEALKYLDNDSLKIAIANHRWRKSLHEKYEKVNKPVGIFSGYRVILHIHEEDMLRFKRILEAGCGAVVDINNPEDFHRVTHCVKCDEKHLSKDQKEDLDKEKIPCVPVSHLKATIYQH